MHLRSKFPLKTVGGSAFACQTSYPYSGLHFRASFSPMTTKKRFLISAAAILIAVSISSMAARQQFVTKKPAADDWAALAKLPDFNGVWERGGAPRGNGGQAGNVAAPRGGGPPAAGAPRGAAPATAGQGANAPAAAQRGGAGGRGGRGGGMQLNPEYEAKSRAYQASAPEDNTTANCLPPGMPGIMTQPYPMEFLLTPGKVTIVIEAYTQVRHIYTDGRKLPEDPDPKFFGTSIGHWEGDTLVAESIGFSPSIRIAPGVAPSDKMRIVERFRLADPDNMTIETTISDPVVLVAPYTTSSNLRRHREWTIEEYICEENNRNSVDSSGKAGINLTPPAANSSK